MKGKRIVLATEQDLKRELRRIEPFIKRIRESFMSPHAACDVAKVYLGLQPGDDITYNPRGMDILNALDALSEMNRDFILEEGDYRKGRKLVVFYNPAMISKIEEKMRLGNLIDIYKKIRKSGNYDKEAHWIVGRVYRFSECCISRHVEKNKKSLSRPKKIKTKTIVSGVY